MIEVRCPSCDSLQFKIEQKVGSTTIETKCQRTRCHTWIRIVTDDNGNVHVYNITRPNRKQYPSEYK